MRIDDYLHQNLWTLFMLNYQWLALLINNRDFIMLKLQSLYGRSDTALYKYNAALVDQCGKQVLFSQLIAASENKYRSRPLSLQVSFPTRRVSYIYRMQFMVILYESDDTVRYFYQSFIVSLNAYAFQDIHVPYLFQLIHRHNYSWPTYSISSSSTYKKGFENHV